MPYLTGVDVLGVQGFVFASNRLRDVVGASQLVHEATSRTGPGLVEGLAGSGEVLVAAGGNAVVEFAGDDPEGDAWRFAARYSRWLLEHAPGLDVALAHNAYAEGELAAALGALQVRLARAKVERVPSVPLGGLGVTAWCRQTGRPATGVDADDRSVPLSTAMLAARVARDRAGGRWDRFLGRASTILAAAPGVGGCAGFPDELDQFRSRGDLSMVAIAHLDGNHIGRHIADWFQECQQKGLPDATVRDHYREWSQALERVGERTFEAVVERAARALAPGEGDWQGRIVVRGAQPRLTFLVPLDQQAVKPPRRLLPVRPVLLGGDDLTFMADARVALDLVETGLAAFERHAADVPHLRLEDGLHACAGVAIVGAHAPILRAYELAEQLCRSAKRGVRATEAGKDASALDWHVGAVRPGERLERLRERQYRAGGLDLTCRPYLLGAASQRGTWRWLASELLGREAPGSLRGGGWGAHRGKVKQLEDLVREGPTALAKTLVAWRVTAPELAAPGGLDNGFLGARTPLPDAVELLDLHQTLTPPAPALAPGRETA